MFRGSQVKPPSSKNPLPESAEGFWGTVTVQRKNRKKTLCLKWVNGKSSQAVIAVNLSLIYTLLSIMSR